jgi:hypothetical protein
MVVRPQARWSAKSRTSAAKALTLTLQEDPMTEGVTYRTKNLTKWNEDRRGEVEFDAVARVYLADAEITDRDRIAFALRELRKRGYDVEACPVDWTKPLMISSVVDCEWGSFGEPGRSQLYKRLDRIARRSRLLTQEQSDGLHEELYPEQRLFDHNDFLQYAYEFTFKGDPALVEAIFQAVGFATQHGLMVPDDGSETHQRLGVAPAAMVIV